jgi:hypothetical protein
MSNLEDKASKRETHTQLLNECLNLPINENEKLYIINMIHLLEIVDVLPLIDAVKVRMIFKKYEGFSYPSLVRKEYLTE